MEYGYTSDLWMSKTIIKNADPNFVKMSVMQLLNELHAQGNDLSVVEIFDRLVQVSETGDYTPPDLAMVSAQHAVDLADEVLDGTYLSDDDREELVAKFQDLLSDRDEEDE